MLCSGVGSFLAVCLAGFVIFFTCNPWTLVKKIFLAFAVLFSVITFFPVVFFIFTHSSENLLQTWWQNQLTLDKPQPLYLIKTWLWTWWPLWPIVTAFSIQAYQRGFLSLSHLKMPLTLLICTVAMPISGIFISDGIKFVPVVPLAKSDEAVHLKTSVYVPACKVESVSILKFVSPHMYLSLIPI